MDSEKKRALKDRYKILKRIYINLKKEYKKTSDPKRKDEIKFALSGLVMEIANIRQSLIDYTFAKLYRNRNVNFSYDEIKR